MDTMVAHSVMHPEMSHSLDTLTSLYTFHPFYKEMRKEATEGRYTETLWQYNGIDCCITFEVACKLFNEMASTNTLEFFNRVSMPVTKTLVRMEATGVNIDHELRRARGETLQTEVDDILANPTLKGINPNSPKQIISYLTNLGIKLSIPRGEKHHRLMKPFCLCCGPSTLRRCFYHGYLGCSREAQDHINIP